MSGSRWATAGSVAAAAASSACCWLPLVMIVTGFSAVGASAFFERYRTVFLVVAIMLLGVGFFLQYRPGRAACAADGSCPPSAGWRSRLNQGLLWVSTLLVLALALFPHYVGRLLGPPAVAESAVTTTLVLEIDGMTCAGCEAGVEAVLSELPNVATADADHITGRAVVESSAGVTPGEEALRAAVARAGYSLRAVTAMDPRASLDATPR